MIASINPFLAFFGGFLVGYVAVVVCYYNLKRRVREALKEPDQEDNK